MAMAMYSYGMTARPDHARHGDTYTDLTTGKTYVYTEGEWRDDPEPYTPPAPSIPDPTADDIGKLLGVVADGTGAKYEPVLIPAEFPAVPEEEGTYHLSAEVTSTGSELSWVADTAE